MTPYVSTFAQKFAPGNFVTELGTRRVGVTMAIKDKTESNPLVLVKWLDDLSSEAIRSEYIELAN